MAHCFDVWSSCSQTTDAFELNQHCDDLPDAGQSTRGRQRDQQRQHPVQNHIRGQWLACNLHKIAIKIRRNLESESVLCVLWLQWILAAGLLRLSWGPSRRENIPNSSSASPPTSRRRPVESPSSSELQVQQTTSDDISRNGMSFKISLFLWLSGRALC